MEGFVEGGNREVVMRRIILLKRCVLDMRFEWCSVSGG